MAVYNVTNAAWVAVAGSQTIQVRKGRVYYALTNTPADEDWLVYPDGAVIVLTTGGYAKAVDVPVVIAGMVP